MNRNNQFFLVSQPELNELVEADKIPQAGATDPFIGTSFATTTITAPNVRGTRTRSIGPTKGANSMLKSNAAMIDEIAPD